MLFLIGFCLCTTAFIALGGAFSMAQRTDITRSWTHPWFIAEVILMICPLMMLTGLATLIQAAAALFG